MWIGALIHVLRTAAAWRAHRHRVRALVGTYARLTLALFVVVIGTGTVATLLLVRSWAALLTTGYGYALLAKLALVAAAALLALAARRRLRSRSPQRPVPGRAAHVESVVLAAVLAAAAMLTVFPPPQRTSTDAGFLPPVSGPAIRLGAFAGNISIMAVASENQLELRLRTPDIGTQPRYRVSAHHPSAGRLTLRGCGPGCYFTPLAWAPGTNRLDLRVAADGWDGGTARIDIPWPPTLDTAILPAVLTTMRATKTIRMTETVTSNTTRYGPAPVTLTMTGKKFLASEPYGDTPSLAGIAVLTRTPAGTEIGFGLPAEAVTVRLNIGPDHRIHSETLIGPKHHIRRAFTYP